jgi:serine/threonine-protein kinase RIO1
MENEKTIVLEPSTNTHTMTNVLNVEKIDENILKIKTGKNSQVLHGEHGTIAIESTNVIKYVQQELNPVTKKLQNAWD